MANNLKGYDANQVLRSVFDVDKNTLRVSIIDGSSGGGSFEVVISHENDSIRLGDGTNFITSTTIGPKTALDVAVNGEIDIEDLDASKDNVAIHDQAGHELDINPDGTLNAVVNGKKLFFTGSVTANNADLVPSTDVSDYKNIVFQLTGTFVATVRPQFSNDNVTWVDGLLQTINNAATTPAVSIAAVGIYKVPITGRYFRLRTTAFTSGTVVSNTVITALDVMDYGQRQTSATQSGAWNVGNATANVTGTGAALNATPIALTTVIQYDQTVVALTGTWNATIVAEATNDGTNFFVVPVQRIDSLTALPQMSMTGNGLYRIPMDFNQLRLRISAYTSGTVAANARISSSDADHLGPELTIDSGNTVNQFNEISSVGAGVLTTVLSYTPTVGGTLQQVNASGDNKAEYHIFINGVLVDKRRSYYTDYNVLFDFKRGLAFNAGQTILVRVLHNASTVGSFSARLQTVEN